MYGGGHASQMHYQSARGGGAHAGEPPRSAGYQLRHNGVHGGAQANASRAGGALYLTTMSPSDRRAPYQIAEAERLKDSDLSFETLLAQTQELLPALWYLARSVSVINPLSIVGVVSFCWMTTLGIVGGLLAFGIIEIDGDTRTVLTWGGAIASFVVAFISMAGILVYSGNHPDMSWQHSMRVYSPFFLSFIVLLIAFAALAHVDLHYSDDDDEGFDDDDGVQCADDDDMMELIEGKTFEGNVYLLFLAAWLVTFLPYLQSFLAHLYPEKSTLLQPLFDSRYIFLNILANEQINVQARRRAESQQAHMRGVS